MFNISSNSSEIFVKAFIKDDAVLFSVPEGVNDNISVLITDMQTTKRVKIDSVKETDNKQLCISIGEEEYILDWEPKVIRKMENGILVNKYECLYLLYDEIPKDDYGKAIEAIKNQTDSYRLIGWVKGDQVVTSVLVDMWIDNGENHAITKSGSHYVW